jgi:CTD small phosphatase-like protein 2
VLDLDETLIHYDIDEEKNQGYYLIRPHAMKFLWDMSKYFEIVIFTAAIPEYANWIIDNMDTEKYITHRLYRQHTTQCEEYAMKDIAKTGRSLNKTLIVDNIDDNYNHTTPDNGIKVPSWFDEVNDRVLEILGPFLISIVTKNVDDVRILLKNFKPKLEKCLEEGRDVPEFTPLDLIDL